MTVTVTMTDAGGADPAAIGLPPTVSVDLTQLVEAELRASGMPVRQPRT